MKEKHQTRGIIDLNSKYEFMLIKYKQYCNTKRYLCVNNFSLIKYIKTKKRNNYSISSIEYDLHFK